MDNTPKHGLTVPNEDGTDPAAGHTQIRALGADVDDALDDIAPSQIQNQTAGKLLIANASGVITGTTISGDITVSSTGEVQIGPKKVGTAELDDGAVSMAKLAPKSVTGAKIMDSAVGEGQISNGAVTRSKTSGFIQTARVAAGAGSVTIPWPVAFANTNYTAVVTTRSTDGTANHFDYQIVDKTAAAIVVSGPVGYPLYVVYECIGIAD